MMSPEQFDSWTMIALGIGGLVVWAALGCWILRSYLFG